MNSSKATARIAHPTHSRRPRIRVTNENIAHIRQLIEQDQRFTLLQISEELCVSYASVQSISKQLGFTKISAGWVLLVLNDDQNTA